MKFLTFLLLTLIPTSLSSPTSSASLPHSKRQSIDVNAFINKEFPIALTGIFRNLGGGEFARTADKGCVIASPSTASPDYFFQWTRDSALTFKLLFNQFKNGNSSIEAYIRDYVTESNKLQHVDNPAGGYTTGGLGEAKFLVNGQAFTGGWGRPQLDGPALRAIVLTGYAQYLLDKGDTSYVNSILYQPVMPYNTVIKADLEYVSHNWQQNGFDLWEEINARHFFTLMVQRRALLEGAELADRLNDGGAATWYRQQADAIGSALPSFWDSGRGYLQAMQNANTGRGGLDCGTLLGALHGNGKRGHGLYTPDSDEVLATLDALIRAMQPLYAVNNNGNPGIAIGRYPEDVYDGAGTSRGNPWFICTLTAGEIIYNAVNTYSAQGSLTVGTKSINFFKRFLGSATAGAKYTAGSANYNSVVNGMKQFADNFVNRAGSHVATNGSISEQFSRDNGYMTGARDLTWSYASFLTTALARQGNTAF